ncbi:peptide chain release factor 1-like, mitochondrial [Gigantopelta aegis]|uniref:peptide chain release factor 1-like, mitochondrial n=1 Tax=Gigantopelta aegis TaxID=1735272 RepID=UPI001B88756C|nr:peptide chain release factor 1-like, mitochondrial [Gigantopelta aegis]XP_041365304.1 peptide chain release factor 1-like, mitochondrial [Gigantopelta aegis]
MSTACLARTFTSTKLMSHPIYSFRPACIHHVKQIVQSVSCRSNILGNCFSKQSCLLQGSVCSIYLGDKHIAKQMSSDLKFVASDNCSKSIRIFKTAAFRPGENCRQETANEKLKLLHKTGFAFDSEKVECLKQTYNLPAEPKIPNSLNYTDLCSGVFQTSENRTFNKLFSSQKYTPTAYCIRHYHTGIQSLPWLRACILPKTCSQSLPVPHPEWLQCRCFHREALPERFDIHKNPTFKQYLDSLLSEFEHINRILSNQTSEQDVNVKELNSRIVQLTPLVSVIRELEKLDKQIEELDVLVSDLSTSDTELKHMAETEREDCIRQMEQLQLQLIDLMVGYEQVDKNDIILEINAGVGGQEAMLFAGEMFDLYQVYSHWKGWSFEIINSDISEQGGLRKASASVCGVGVYRLLKFESGVHRVQRVPKTEKAGRIHTSTMTVSVLPQPTEIEVVIQSRDLRVETFKASGKGGQHVNTTDSAVRITHLPTGMVAECQQERSQIKNKALALQILRSRIYEKELASQQMKYKADRKIQVGTAGRSEKIRTYNFNQDRITDHRINYSLFNLDHFMTSGEDLNSLIGALLKESQYNFLDDILEDFVKNRKKELA